MADDIVTRLREPGFCGVAAQHDAADEIERLRAEVNSMASAQAGWGRVARQAGVAGGAIPSGGIPGVSSADVDELLAELGRLGDPDAIPTEVLADIDSQLCEDCEPFTSVRIVERLREHGWRITRG